MISREICSYELHSESLSKMKKERGREKNEEEERYTGQSMEGKRKEEKEKKITLI